MEVYYADANLDVERRCLEIVSTQGGLTLNKEGSRCKSELAVNMMNMPI